MTNNFMTFKNCYTKSTLNLITRRSILGSVCLTSDKVGTERHETDLRLTQDWPETDLWEKDEDSVLYSTLSRTDRHTDRVTPWAPWRSQKRKFMETTDKYLPFHTGDVCSWTWEEGLCQSSSHCVSTRQCSSTTENVLRVGQSFQWR